MFVSRRTFRAPFLPITFLGEDTEHPYRVENCVVFLTSQWYRHVLSELSGEMGESLLHSTAVSVLGITDMASRAFIHLTPGQPPMNAWQCKIPWYHPTSIPQPSSALLFLLRLPLFLELLQLRL